MKKNKTAPKGRKCRFPHCDTVLSIYNHETWCHVHIGQGIHEHKKKVHRI